MHNWFLIRSGGTARKDSICSERPPYVCARACWKRQTRSWRAITRPICSLDDIARRVASSRRQLQRAYAEIGHTTFRAHLTRVRMDRAAELLSTRMFTVREVAHRVGYRQPAQFAKAFRRHRGIAPSDFRSGGNSASSPLRPAPPDERAEAQPDPPLRPHLRRSGCVGCRVHGLRGESDERPASGRLAREPGAGPSDAPDRGGRLGAGHRARPADRLVPGPRLRAGRADRHAVGRPADRLGARCSCWSRRSSSTARSSSGCGPARSSRTGRRSTATPSSRSSGPRSRRSCSSASAPTPTSC